MATYVALCRGINVGGKNKVPMAHLRELFVDAGAEAVETLIQSGNVVFEAPAGRAAGICDGVVRAVASTLSVSMPLVLRSGAQFRKIAARHPLGDAGAEPKAYSVGFLSRRPSAKEVRGLEPARHEPDLCQVKGAELYLHFPGGQARSKLTTAYLDRVLGATTTVRNWATVQKIAAVVAARSS